MLHNIPAECKSLLGQLGTEIEGARVLRNVGNHAPDSQGAAP